MINGSLQKANGACVICGTVRNNAATNGGGLLRLYVVPLPLPGLIVESLPYWQYSVLVMPHRY